MTIKILSRNVLTVKNSAIFCGQHVVAFYCRGGVTGKYYTAHSYCEVLSLGHVVVANSDRGGSLYKYSFQSEIRIIKITLRLYNIIGLFLTLIC